MVNPVRVDAIVDLLYGALIALSVVLIVTLDTNVGIAFGVGVFASYLLHVVWKMARFDPDWMTRVVQESVEETVDETVGDQLEEVRTRVETVDERVSRRPREEQVEELIDESVDGDSTGSAENR
ncbi:hypothetical protein ACFQGT_17480 [Natrialbaceae archaeon GCM10025810]|uniref:hypothetical protein n=1 Tax=Halovalidus salilacus TaxID=3075124 RepID=UPI003606618E